MIRLLAAAALAAASPAVSATSAAAAAGEPATAVDPAAKAAGIKLARILFTEETQVATAERLVESALVPVFRNDENFQVLEEAYPGFTDAVIAEFRKIMGPYVRAELPAYYDRVGSLLASQLTKDEIEDLTPFYQSPTGQKLLNGMLQNYTLDSTVKEIVADPDKPTSYSAVADDHSHAAKATMKLIDESDAPALIALSKKPYFARLKALGPAMRKLEQDFSNEPSPALDKEIEAIFDRVLARFEEAAEAAEKKR